MPGPGRKPSTEATLRMPPLRRARLSAKRSDRSVAIRTLRSTMVSCCARSSFAAGPSIPKPALLTTISRLEPCFCRRLRQAIAGVRQGSDRARSCGAARGRPPQCCPRPRQAAPRAAPPARRCGRAWQSRPRALRQGPPRRRSQAQWV